MAVAFFATALLPAHAGMPSVQRELFVDTQGHMSLADVQQQSFQPAPEIVALGYTSAALWLRITIAQGQEQPLVFSVRPTYLDDVRLYRQPGGAGTPWEMVQQGDRWPFAEREREDLAFAFNVQSRADADTQLYLRVQTSSTLAVSAQVSAEGDARLAENMQYMLLATYATLMLLIGMYAIVNAVLSRNLAWLLTGLNGLVGIVMLAVWTGFAARHIAPNHPEWVDLSVNWLGPTQLLLVTLTFAAFNRMLKGSDWIYRIRLLVIPVFAWQIWHVLTGDSHAAVVVNSLASLAYTFIALVEPWTYRIHDKPLKWIMRCSNTILSLYLVYFFLPLLGLTRMTELHFLPALPANLYTAVMLSIVAMRADYLKRRQADALIQQVNGMEKQMAWEKQRQEEATSFLAMLTHELKSPLSVVQMTLDLSQPTKELRDSAQQAVRDISQVIERAAQSDRLDLGKLERNSMRFDVLALVQQLVHDTRNGHQIRIVCGFQQVVELHSDPAWVRIIVLNLIDNAQKYGATNEPIRIDLQIEDHADPPGLRIDVSNPVGDCGKPDAQYIFSKYYRAPAARRLTGTGLGLFIIKALSRDLGGQLIYHDEDAEQVRFRLWLPLQAT